MKKLILLNLGLFLVALFALKPIYAAGLSDISSHKNRTAIEYLNQNGIVGGYEDGTYRPDAPINRAEFTKIIIEATYDEATIENCLAEQMQPNWTYTFFPDVDKNAWFAKYICVAKIKGVVKGYSDGLFKPNDKINKAEAIKILISAQGYSVPTSVTGNLFSDVSAIDWFAPYVKVAMDNNLLEDTGSSSLGATAFLTRGGMSEMTYRALVSEGGVFESPSIVEDLPSLEPVTTEDANAAGQELADLILQILKTAPETDLEDFIFNFTDDAEKIYLRNQLRISEVSDEILYGDEENPFPEEFPIRRLMFLSANPGETIQETASIHKEDDKLLIGISSSFPSATSDDRQSFTCFPFVYSNGWKLKLPNVFDGDVDFTEEGVIESCDKEIEKDAILSESDLTGAYLDYYTYFPVRLYLNGYLIDNVQPRFSRRYITALPLIHGQNTLQIVPAYHEDFEDPTDLEDYIDGIKTMVGEEMYETMFSDVGPDELKVEIENSDSENITEVLTSEATQEVTHPFDFQP